VIQWQHEYVGKNYNAEVGYVPRVGYFKIDPALTYLLYPKVLQVRYLFILTVESVNYWNTSSKLTDYTNIFAYGIQMKNRSALTFWTAKDYVKLQFKFNPLNPYTSEYYVANQSEHSWHSAGFDYVSTSKRLLTYTLSTRVGGYYGDGTRVGLRAWLGIVFNRM
jgi:hypothetical protein